MLTSGINFLNFKKRVKDKKLEDSLLEKNKKN